MKRLVIIWLTGVAAAGDDPKLDFARGVLAEQRGDHAAAAAAFEKAHEEDPAAFSLAGRVAEIRRRKGDIAGASEIYREFSSRHPERMDGQLAYADFLRSSASNDDFVEKMALGVLEDARARFPENLAIKRRLFRVYESLERREDSIKLFESLAASDASVAEMMEAVKMARTLFPASDSEARERVDGLYLKAAAASLRNPVVARAASDHFRGTGRLSEAVEVLTKHVSAAPESLELRIRRGILLLAAKRSKEGEEALIEVLSIDPKQGLAHQALAKLYREQDCVPEALPHAAEALKIRGGSPSDFLELADEFLGNNQPREARLLLEKAVFYHPKASGLLVKLAVASRRDPESRESATRLFREAESASEGDNGPANDPEFLSEFAESLWENGQVSSAEERLRRAIRAYPAEKKSETAAALRRLAGIWQQEGRNEEAAESLLQRADSLDSP